MRTICPRCRWPQEHCWCHLLPPMRVESKFVFLMHPHEDRKVKSGTGRFAALSLEGSELLTGVGFDTHPRLNALLGDPAYMPMLLYPGDNARNLSTGMLAPADLGGKRLLVILLDATWFLAKKMLKLSARLQALPRIMFTPSHKSRFIIKRQPGEHCLSTLEATHELLVGLETAGLDHYDRPSQLLTVFQAMQDFQIACAADPERGSYRHPPYQGSADRLKPRARKKRTIFFRDNPPTPSGRN